MLTKIIKFISILALFLGMVFGGVLPEVALSQIPEGLGNCIDAEDNDDDGLIDVIDPDCHDDGDALDLDLPPSYNPDLSETSSNTPPACAPGNPEITSSLSETTTVGTYFSYQITASGTPSSFSASGLPDGLSLDSLTGVITGTTTATGTVNVLIGASNDCGDGENTLVIVVDDAPVSNPTEDTLELCSNSTDDDGDQLTDLDDADCAAFMPKLTVTKVVVNDNGGAKADTDFSLFVDGNPVSTGVQNTYQTGSHTVSETTDPDYTGTIGGDCATDGTITLVAGDVKSCTITNDDNAPAEQNNNNNGGGGGGGALGNGVPGGATGFAPTFSGGGNGPIGLVLGASTTTTPEVPVVPSCSAYIGSYLKMGRDNPIEEVKRLQEFLNEYIGSNLPVTGLFGPMTHEAVKAFQVKEANEILNPWISLGLHSDLNTGTGYVYKTTLRRINMIKCNTLNIPIPQLP